MIGSGGVKALGRTVLAAGVAMALLVATDATAAVGAAAGSDHASSQRFSPAAGRVAAASVQSISFPALPARTRGQSVALSATATSSLAVSFSSTTASVCTVNGSAATLLLPGTCTIAANQAGDANWSAAPQVTQSFTVKPVPGDLDGNGTTDLLWMNANGTASVWLMGGSGVLSSTTFGPYAGWTLASSDSDFNGDGLADLVWTNSNGAVSIWLMNGLSPISQTTIGPFAGWTLVSANADFNGDGKSDLLWWNAGTGQAAIWLMHGASAISTAVYGPYAGWTVLSGNNDFNGDGKSDLLWVNSNGAASLWLMNGTTVAATTSFGPYAGWTVASGDADYNGDGNTDLLWTNTSGQAALWLMNGLSLTSSGTFGPYGGWSVMPGRRDFNGDGQSDLLWTNTNGAVSAWLMSGTTALSTAVFGPYSGWSLLPAKGDYNGDGNTDLLWTNTNGAISLWMQSGLTTLAQANFGPYTGWSVLPGFGGPSTVVPAIQSGPTAVSVVVPAAANFSVSLAGATAPALQWQLSLDNGATFVNIAGATQASLRIGSTSLAMNGYQYRVVATDGAGTTTSAAAVLTVLAAPSTTQAISAGADGGAPGEPVTFLVTEAFDTSNAYNAGHNLMATVPAGMTVPQANVSRGSTSCSGGAWPCTAGQSIVWGSVQTSNSNTNSAVFTAVPVSTTPGSQATSTLTSTLSGVAPATAGIVNSSATSLQVALDAQAPVAPAGGNLEFVVSYGNPSASSAAAQLLVPLPAGVTFISATDGGAYNVTTGKLSWSLGSIAAGSGGQVSFVVQLANPTAGSALVNASAQLLDPVTGSVLAEASATGTASADPSLLSVASSAGVVAPGGSLVYTITEAYQPASNYNGGHNLYAVVPAYTSVNQYAVTRGAACSSGSWPCTAGQLLTWGSVQTSATSSQSFQFTAQVSSTPAPPAGSLLQSTIVSDASGGNPASVTSVVLPASDWQLAMDSQSGVIAAGGPFVVAVSYGNASTAARPVALRLTLPPGLQALSTSDGGVIAPASGYSVEWDIASVPAGSSGQVYVTCQLASNYGGASLLTPIAQLDDASNAPTGLLAQASLPLTFVGEPTPVSVAFTGGTAAPGGHVQVLVTEAFVPANYNGGHNLYAVVPAYTSVNQFDADNGTCTSGTWPCLAGQAITWSSIQTSVQNSQSRQFSATVSPSAPTGALLQTSATGNISGVGMSSATLPVVGASGWQLTAVPAIGAVAPGANLTVTYTYANLTGSTTSSLLVAPVPAGWTFQSASGASTFNATAGLVSWDLGSVSSGANGQVTASFTAPAAPAGTPVVNLFAKVTTSGGQPLAQASGIAAALSDPTTDTISGVVTTGVATFSVSESFIGNAYNGGGNLYFSVPEGMTVLTAGALQGSCHGFCGAMQCTSGAFPCTAGEMLYVDIQTDTGTTNTYQFTATPVGSAPPASGSILTSTVTRQGSGATAASTSVTYP